MTENRNSQLPPVIPLKLTELDRIRIEGICLLFHKNPESRAIGFHERKGKWRVAYDIDVKATLKPIIHELERLIDEDAQAVAPMDSRIAGLLSLLQPPSDCVPDSANCYDVCP
jgi:hypothetical protein